MRQGMRILRNLVIMAAVVMVAVVVMPKNVWADATTASISFKVGGSASSSQNYSKGSTGNTVVLEYTYDAPLATGESEEISYTLPTSSVVTNVKKTEGTDSVTFEFDANSTGTATISAQIIKTTSSGSSSTVADGTFTINVGGISLDTTSITDYASSPVTLTASADATYSVGTMTWTSSNESVATVTKDATDQKKATVTILKIGTATITVSDSNGASATCSVNVTSIPATGISLSQTSGTIDFSSATVVNPVTVTATLTPSNSDSSITWSSDNTSIATVQTTSGNNKEANITGLSGGVAHITAKVSDSLYATYTVTVKNPVKEVTISPTTGSIYVGNDPISFTSTITSYKTGATIYPTIASYTWLSSSSGVATVSGTGTTASLTAVSAGSTNVTLKVTDDGGTSVTSNSATVTVNAGIPVSSMSLSLNPVKVTKGYAINVTSNYGTSGGTPTVSKSKISWSLSGNTSGTTTYASIPNNSTGETVRVTGSYQKTSSGMTLTAKIAAADNLSGGEVSVLAPVYVYDNPSISYSDNKLSISLPDSIYTGNSNDIDSVTRGVIKVYYNDECLWTSDRSSSYKNGSTVSASSIQSIIENSSIYDKLKSVDNDTTTLQFRIYGASDSSTNDTAYGSTDVPVYRLTVSGSNIVTAKKYAVKGVDVKLTATPATGYTFSKWSDGTTTNPRTVTVSGSATYTAEAVSKTAAAAAAGTNGTGTANANLDKVPKTGEGSDVLIMWSIFIGCSILAGILLIIQLRQRAAFAKNTGENTGAANIPDSAFDKKN